MSGADQNTIAGSLGAWIAALDRDAVPASVRESARLCLLHDLLIGLAGRPHTAPIQDLARSIWALPAQSTLLATGERISPEGAAFANAALMNVRSQDDTHEPSVTHPGVPVIAAALAAAELAGASGADLVTALAAGYEATGRIGRHCGAQLSARGIRAAAMLGIFGATAASSRLLGLDARQTANALALATQMAGGTSQVWVEGGTEFTTQLGMCARNGLTAARLAAGGVTASSRSFEGRSGLYRAYAGVEIDASAVLEGLGRDWAVSEVTVKPSPVCAALQGPVAELARLVREHGLSADKVDAVTLTLSTFEATYPGIDNPGPINTPAAAKMSAQFCLALVLLHGSVGFDALADCSAPGPTALAGRVNVTPDPNLRQRMCRIDVRLRDGSTLSGRVDQAVGRPDRQLIVDCARGLRPETGASEAAIERFADVVTSLDDAADLMSLFDAYAALRSEDVGTSSIRMTA